MSVRTKRSRHRAGSRWRVRANRKDRPVELRDDGIFDELVVDNWLHVEQMGPRQWWMAVGPLRIDVQLRPDGKMDVSVDRDSGPGGHVDIRAIFSGEHAATDGETWWGREKK